MLLSSDTHIELGCSQGRLFFESPHFILNRIKAKTIMHTAPDMIFLNILYLSPFKLNIYIVLDLLTTKYKSIRLFSLAHKISNLYLLSFVSVINATSEYLFIILS